jgi:hypothetical protein
LHAVIPCYGYEGTFASQDDLRHFLALRKSAAILETLNYPEPSEEAFLAAGHRVVELSDLLIAVWDGKVARGKGGTADIVGYARELGARLCFYGLPGLHDEQKLLATEFLGIKVEA